MRLIEQQRERERVMTDRELWHGKVHRTPYPAISYRVVEADREIRLHLTATLPLPPNATARVPRLAERLFDQLFRGLFEQAGEFLAEFLRPAPGDRP